MAQHAPAVEVVAAQRSSAAGPSRTAGSVRDRRGQPRLGLVGRRGAGERWSGSSWLARSSIGLLGGVGLLASACAGAPSALDPRGPQAARIAELGWLMFAVSGVVFVIVMAVLLGGLFRPRRARRDDGQRPPEDGVVGEVGETGLVVVAGIALPVVVLTGITIFTLRTLAQTAIPPAAPVTVVEVVGHMWWWEVRYPREGFVTANEIHVPAGQPVELRLRSPDVIHSFWVPQLMGKMDLVPGRENVTWIEASEPGMYRGLCAEFCGVQHAKMMFMLVALPPAEFAGWAAAQRAPAVEPIDPAVLRGAQAFARTGCINCHVIRYGSGAVGNPVGPDLTHVGSRLTLGAGIMPNTRGHLAGWIGNPQALKPGNLMPVVDLDADSLLTLTAYLESLR